MPHAVVWVLLWPFALVTTEQRICGNESFTDIACVEASRSHVNNSKAHTCEVGGRGVVLPVGGDAEHRLPVGFRVVLYVFALGVCVCALYCTSVMLVCWNAESKATDDVGATDANFFEEPSARQAVVRVCWSAGTGICRVLVGGCIFAALMALYFDLVALIGCIFGFSETAIAAIAWPLYIAVMVAPAARGKCRLRRGAAVARAGDRAGATPGDRAAATRLGAPLEASRATASSFPVAPEIAGDVAGALEIESFDVGLSVEFAAIAPERQLGSAEVLPSATSKASTIRFPDVLEEARAGEAMEEGSAQDGVTDEAVGTAALATRDSDFDTQVSTL